MKSRKVDNSNLPAKLALRRYMLDKYHADGGVSVLDCCQGSGVIWGRLRKEYDVPSYWGVDVKPKKGRLKIDSARILAQPGWSQCVIDIDTYGSPWKHWMAMLPNVTRPITVFLTIGQVSVGGGSRMISEVRSVCGFGGLRVPQSISARINASDYAMKSMLAAGRRYGIIVDEAVEAVSNGSARYVGVRLRPAQKNASPASPGEAQHSPAG